MKKKILVSQARVEIELVIHTEVWGPKGHQRKCIRECQSGILNPGNKISQGQKSLKRYSIMDDGSQILNNCGFKGSGLLLSDLWMAPQKLQSRIPFISYTFTYFRSSRLPHRSQILTYFHGKSSFYLLQKGQGESNLVRHFHVQTTFIPQSELSLNIKMKFQQGKLRKVFFFSFSFLPKTSNFCWKVCCAMKDTLAEIL